MKCVGLLTLLISIQWVSHFIPHCPYFGKKGSNYEFGNNGNIDDKALDVEENDYVQGMDIHVTTEPENVVLRPAEDTEPLHTSSETLVTTPTYVEDEADLPSESVIQSTATSETLSTTQTYVVDDADLSSESIFEPTTEPYFFKNLEDLLYRSSEVLGNISNSTATSIVSITSSLNVISKTLSVQMLPKVAEQVSFVYKGLTRISGPEVIILKVLANSLQSIFSVITSVVSEVESAIGIEASEAMKDYIGSVEVSLRDLLSLLDGSVTENVNLFGIIQAIAKTVQYVAASVTSISLTVSEAIDGIGQIVVEAVISLQIIFGAVLYVTQWVLSLGVSIFYSLVGSESEVVRLLSELTVLISSTLEKVSRICLVISMIHSDSLESIFMQVVPLIEDLKQLLTLSYTPISGNIVKIVFNIPQSLTDTPISNEIPVSELNSDTTGTIPEILSKLTGKLISISTELSSSLFSLNNSLKISSNLGTSALKVISNILSLVLTRFTTVNGTVFQTFAMISDLLQETFTDLSGVLTKFSVLGDFSESLNASVSNIHNALRSLIDSINISTATTYLDKVDPIKNVAQSCQILVTSFFAISNAVAQANKNISNKLAEIITYLPYIVSTIIVVVQYVLGASITKVMVTYGNLPANLEELTLAITTILQRITSITANITLAQSGTDDINYNEILSNILSPVSELNILASTSLSAISEILANVKVSLDTVKNVAQ